MVPYRPLKRYADRPVVQIAQRTTSLFLQKKLAQKESLPETLRTDVLEQLRNAPWHVFGSDKIREDAVTAMLEKIEAFVLSHNAVKLQLVANHIGVAFIELYAVNVWWKRCFVPYKRVARISFWQLTQPNKKV